MRQAAEGDDSQLQIGGGTVHAGVHPVVDDLGKPIADLVILLTRGGNDTMTISYHLIRIANEQNKTSEGAAISYVMLFMVIVLTNLYLYFVNRRAREV